MLLCLQLLFLSITPYNFHHSPKIASTKYETGMQLPSINFWIISTLHITTGIPILCFVLSSGIDLMQY